jgi:hypothetical protein
MPSAVLALHDAVIVTPVPLRGPEAKAVAVLIDEIERRTGIRLTLSDLLPPADRPVIVMGRRADLLPSADPLPADGFAVRAEGETRQLILAGNDARGLLYAVGHLLRALRMGRGRVELSLPYETATAPRWPLRGHQLGYRFLSNCYDGWDVPQFDRYIRELALWGANAVELLPLKTGAPEESPHFHLPRAEMMEALSGVIASYGLDVWVWWPALDGDYADPAVTAAALEDWAAICRRLPRLDAVFVPGGDPGHTAPEVLFPYLEKQIANVRRFHPKAALWVSPQGFNDEQMAWFFRHLAERRPPWLGGVVFGPWVNMELGKFRRLIPACYPIRFYPDITHTRHCQYPVADWDLAFALTQGREPTCPRPRDMANILRTLQPHTSGNLCYSEGAHDDVNKAVWSALSWDPDAVLENVLRDYARFFIGDDTAEAFARGLLALEENWRGPLLPHGEVEETFRLFQDMESAASPHQLTNWRFLQPLFRAYLDAYTRRRLIHETELEGRALAVLREAAVRGTEPALAEAESILEKAVTAPVALDLRTRIFQLAEALFQTIHHKLSQPLYRALHTGRGAHLDSLDWPLNNRLWLKERFEAIRALPASDQPAAIGEILQWADPGPGGFYDSLGELPVSPRLVRGQGVAEDPAFIRSSMVGFLYLTEPPPPVRTSWMTCACALGGEPLHMEYDGLDPAAAYAVRVVYGQPEYKARLKLTANGTQAVHGFLEKPEPMAPLVFDVPREATRTGRLRLTWQRETNEGSAGYGCSVAEVWLMRKDQAEARREGQ